MNAFAVAGAVFASSLGGALLGMRLGRTLPEHHLDAASKDVVRLCMGLIATLSALILGLVTASAKESFDAQGSAARNVATEVVTLDRTLAAFGPESDPVRGEIRDLMRARVEATAGGGATPAEAVLGRGAGGEAVLRHILDLKPADDAQRWVQSQALGLASDVLRTRWASLTQSTTPVPAPFIAVIGFWLTALFWSFGLFAPRNGMVIAVLALAAASVSACVFLILEMQTPFSGVLHVSLDPLRYALEQLGK
ncbi:MAG TPA: hypothetical protein VMS55_24455 [Myxococcota bacterium]|nr:hypothetical protein [Myxococcota bacterium]